MTFWQSRPGRCAVLAAATALSSLAVAGAALAAEAEDSASAATSVDEVVITARHRSENVQSVPVSVSVVGADLLKKTNTSNIAQVAQLVPSLSFSFFNSRNANLNIRGLGNNIGLANDGIEPGVGFYVDQVYYDRPATATFDMIDIAQVEVLRGPQGTLFGKNSTAGAVTLTSEAPTFAPEATGEISGGNYGYFQSWAAVSGPLVDDRLAGRLTIATTTRAGVMTNVAQDNGDVNNYRNLNIRAQLLWAPTHDLKVRLIGDYSNQETNCCDLVLANVVSPPNGKNFYKLTGMFGYTPFIDPFARQADTNSPIHANQETGGVSAEVDWSLPKLTLTSISAWRFWNWWPANDSDFTPLSVLVLSQNGDYQRQFSQEFRVASSGTNRVDYVGGLYFFYESIAAKGAQQFGNAATAFLLSPALPSLVANNYTLSFSPDYYTTSLAAFGQATWHVTSKLNLAGGIRYTYDEKEGSFYQVASGGMPLTGALSPLAPYRAALGTSDAFTASTYNGQVSGMVDVSYQVTPDILTYVTFSEGSKSGGLNLTQLPAGATEVIAPETIDMVEAGVKTALFEHRVTLNGDIFFENDNNYQANLVNVALGKQYLSNIPKVQSQGVELDLQAQPLEGLSFYNSVTYDRAIYADYPNAPCGLENITHPYCNLSGAPLAGVPEWALAAGGEYDHTLNLGSASVTGYFGVDYTYRSSLYSAATDSIYSRLPDLNLVNARLGVRALNQRWDFYLWAKNLLDANYFTFVSPEIGNTGALTAQLGDPRTYGVTFRFHL
jgi:iron complex outermembrane receptor protein